MDTSAVSIEAVGEIADSFQEPMDTRNIEEEGEQLKVEEEDEEEEDEEEEESYTEVEFNMDMLSRKSSLETSGCIESDEVSYVLISSKIGEVL